MRFDQVRKEFKKTLWDEELDNDRYVGSMRGSFDLGFLHQYQGKKYRCIHCNNEFEESDLMFSEIGTVCISCFHEE